MLERYNKQLLGLFADINSLKRKPENVALCFAIQETLLEKIRKVESKIRSAGKIYADLSTAIRKGRLPRNEVTALKEQQEYEDYKKDFYQRLLSIYRDIGDAVAFTYLSKWDIKPLTLAKEHAGFISGKKGLRLELKCLRHLKLQEIPGILNDLTNSLRHGDITIPVDGKPRLLEIKSGNSSRNSSRAKRQVERANAILKYLETDTGVGIYPNLGDSTMRRWDMASKEKDYQQIITEMMVESIKNRKGFTKKIEPGLYYNVALEEDDVYDTFSLLPKGASPIVFFVNRFKGLSHAYYPFTLSISDPTALFEFYSGNINVTVMVDFNYIERTMLKNGLKINYLQDTSDFAFEVTEIETDFQSRFSRHFFARVASEFLSLKWIINEMSRRVHDVADEQ